jgi:hypothetical protein
MVAMMTAAAAVAMPFRAVGEERTRSNRVGEAVTSWVLGLSFMGTFEVVEGMGRLGERRGPG